MDCHLCVIALVRKLRVDAEHPQPCCWFPYYRCRHYDAQAAAVLGLTATAAAYVLERVTTRTASDSLFPGYYDYDNNDWVPSPEHPDCARTTAQLMAMQDDADDGRILVLPAWPANWHVDFKLHAPQATVVEASYAGGSVAIRSVTPPSRAADIVVIGPSASIAAPAQLRARSA